MINLGGYKGQATPEFKVILPPLPDADKIKADGWKKITCELCGDSPENFRKCNDRWICSTHDEGVSRP